jgi:hypothetical protein
MFLVGEAKQCRERLQEFAERLAIAADPTAGERVMQGYTLKKVRTRKISNGPPPVPAPQHDLF